MAQERRADMESSAKWPVLARDEQRLERFLQLRAGVEGHRRQIEMKDQAREDHPGQDGRTG